MRKREVHAGGPLFCEGVATQFPSDPTQNVTFTYDSTSVTYGIGRLTGRTDPSGSYTFYYDAHGNLTREDKTINTILYTTQYAYNNNNILTSITYPSGRVITYTPDQIGRISQVSTTLNGNPKTLASSITYLPYGGITGLTYGNGLTLTQGYDNQYRISPIVVGSILNLSYGYDANGNVTSITNPDPPGGQVLEPPGVYTYQEGANKLTHISGTPPIDFGYDANGNITTENTWTYVYDLSNQLIRVLDGTTQVAEYTYNGAGQRIKKVTQTETRIFHYDLRGHLIGETNQTGQMLAEYVYLGDQLLSVIKPGESVYYFHNDHLGTPQVLTSDSQAIAWKAVYTPFGEAVPSIQIVENPFRFPGQYFDQETGLHYNYFRYYNPQTGRYITPDPIGLEGGINLFTYVQNDPVNDVDPSGLLGVLGPGFKNVRWPPPPQNLYLPGPDSEMEAPCWMQKMRGYPRSRAIPGQWGTAAAAVALPPAIAGGTALVGGLYFGPGAAALAMRSGTIYILGNPKTYQYGVDFVSGAFTPGPPPASWGGYTGSSVGLAFDWFTNWPSHEPIGRNYPKDLCEQKCH